MKILVDADSCPVKDIIISLAQARNIPVELIASINHLMKSQEGVSVIRVDAGRDVADLAIANRVAAGDIAVTQDFGLAALVLGKKGKAISPRGMIYSNQNIEELLCQRHFSAKARRSGIRTKGPAPFSGEDKQKFIKVFLDLIEKSSASDTK